MTDSIEARVGALLARMSLDEKVGQMCQINAGEARLHEHLRWALHAGRVGSVLNEVDVETVNEMQRLAVEESRLGIPLLIARDVIHGFSTVFPIPLGQAAAWSPALVQDAARFAALEASRCGVNWTFSPMIDVCRDPRWGRIAESFGEDPWLTARLGEAMVRGYQGEDLAAAGAIAACAKHFVAYGAVEAGMDYAATAVPPNEMHNVHLPPFHAAVEEGVAAIMPSFCDLDGVPATANRPLVRDLLRDSWGFDGVVVSDWDSVRQLAIHGFTEDDRASAREAAEAGISMEMHGDAFACHLPSLVAAGEVAEETIDEAVRAILRLKFRLGLFEQPYVDPPAMPPLDAGELHRTAHALALRSCVLLRNEHHTLPLQRGQLRSLAVLGPLADAPGEQLGTWIFDGDAGRSVTPLQALRDAGANAFDVLHSPVWPTTRSHATDGFAEAVRLAARADATVLFLGEEAILSGEAHCRADIGLPGAQTALVRRLRELGKPLIAVVMAGRPLTLTDIIDEVDALLFAWHPGTLAGPAIADLLLGKASPSGKLPVSFPRMVGQIPIYYSRRNTGKPPSPESIVHIDDIDANAPQLSLGMSAFHLDAGHAPLFPFGYGLSYAHFEYADIRAEPASAAMGEPVVVSATVANTSSVAGEEVVQLYLRDIVASVTRPVRELKGFRRLHLAPGESARVSFELGPQQLAFHGRDLERRVEAGEFHAWIGGSSEAALQVAFRVLAEG